MSNRKRLKQICDLFVEGSVCFLGDDEKAQPVCVYISKNNSLQEETARQDSNSARTEILLAMADPMHPEIQHVNMIIAEWTDEELYEAANNQKYEENMTLALADIEADKEWTDKLEYLRRQPELMDDASVPDDDPRRVQWEEYNKEYMDVVDKLTTERHEKSLAEVKTLGREEVTEKFIKDYKDRYSIDFYILEGRVTKLFYAVRECEAKDKGDSRVTGDWDHSTCDHSKRLFETRQDVRELPDHVINRISMTFDNLAVGGKNVGNFLEPQNSSESSAQPSEVVV